MPALLLLLSCTEPPAPAGAVRLDGDGVAVTVTLDPFALEVEDDGAVVLATAAAPAFAPVEETWSALGSPGWYGLETAEGAWAGLGALLSVDTSQGVDATYENGRATVRLDGRRLRVEVDGLDPDADYGALAFVSPGDEQFLGLGERFTRTAFRGAEIYSWCEEGGVGTGEGTEGLFPNGESMTYYPVPWFVSTRGYGFWLDTTFRNTFAFATEGDTWRVEAAEPRVAFEVYVDADPYAAIDAFTERTGRPALPSPWAFGPRRRVSRGSTAMGMPEVEAMRAYDLALTAVDDAVHFLPHLSHSGYEEELADWTADAHALGYKVIGYYNGLVSAEDERAAPWFEEGERDGLFILGPDGEPSLVWLVSGDGQEVAQIDFTNPEAVTWYQGLLDWALDLGYDGWMYDFGEYVQPDDLAWNGMDGRELHNLLPVLYQKAAYEKMEAVRPGDYLYFARSGYTGSQAYTPVTWGGDPAASFESWDGLPSMVRAGVNLGVSGVPFWGGDIGGFHCVADGVPDIEVIIRWIQQGALSPVMQDQNACVFANGDKPTLWDDPVAMEVWGTYARLHTRLFPYLWALADQAVATGRPLVRHVYLEERDPAYAAEDTAHFLGPALFVAPVLERGATTRAVRFPGGERYLDWDAGTVHSGDEVVDAPLEKLPLYLRRGHLVPLLDAAIDTLAAESHEDVVGPADVAGVLDVRAFLAVGGTAAFDLVSSTVFAVSGTLAVTATAAAPGTYTLQGEGSFERDGLAFTAPSGVVVRWEVVVE